MKKISKPGKRPNPGWFKKGPDPKRNMGGNLNAALQSYEVRMKNSAAEKLPPEDFAEILADDVRHHRPGAREFWGKYIIGEPAQKHEVSGGIELHATWNGNGK